MTMRLPVFVAAIARVPHERLDIPARQVQCHCPQPCWVAESTLAMVRERGAKPTYYCPSCCPDEVRGAIQAVSDEVKARLAAGDPTVDPTQPVGMLVRGLQRNYNAED